MKAEQVPKQIPLNFDETPKEDNKFNDVLYADEESQPNYAVDHNWKGVKLHKHTWKVETKQKKNPGEK